MTAASLNRGVDSGPAHAAARRRQTTPVWVDRLLGSDPGLTRLLTATQAVVTIGVAMLVEWIFVRTTHALLIDTHGAVLPPAQAALVAAQHHGLTVIAIILGAIVGLISSFTALLFQTRRQLLGGLAMMPIPMIAGLALGLSVGLYRVPALASLVAVLALGAYCRRFGPHGFIGGMLLFMGDFFGFFLHAEVGLADLGWLAAEIALGSAVAVVAQFTLFFPSRRAALRRMMRSYRARARDVSGRALDLLDAPGKRDHLARRMHRQLVRLNETALMIDAQLVDPGAVPAGRSATVLHQILFDSEMALTNLVRLTERLADLPLTPELRIQVRASLAAVADLDLERAEPAAHDLLDRLRELTSGRGLDRSAQIVIHRFAVSVLGFVDASRRWRDDTSTPAAPDDTRAPFASPVMLVGGWLPGSTMVSATASLEAGVSRRDRVRLTANVRVAIQMGVAVTGAIVLGDILSGRRFYWAVIAAFVTFMGANNSGEQVRKGIFRVLGTVVGVMLGAIGAHLVGRHTDLAILLILVALFFGLYLMRISYAFMVVGITIMVSQLYVQLDEYTNALLVLRLEETALGAAVAVLTVLLVVPLRTHRVARVAIRDYLQGVQKLAELAVVRLLEHDGSAQLREAARDLDSAYQALATTMIGFRTPLMGAMQSRHDPLMQGASAARFYARNLLTDTDVPTTMPEQSRDDLQRAVQQLSSSIDELVAAGEQGDAAQRTYVRSAALFDVVATGLTSDNLTEPPQLALRDLQLLDGVLATMAGNAGLTVVGLDTTGALNSADADLIPAA